MRPGVDIVGMALIIGRFIVEIIAGQQRFRMNTQRGAFEHSCRAPSGPGALLLCIESRLAREELLILHDNKPWTRGRVYRRMARLKGAKTRRGLVSMTR